MVDSAPRRRAIVPKKTVSEVTETTVVAADADSLGVKAASEAIVLADVADEKKEEIKNHNHETHILPIAVLTCYDNNDSTDKEEFYA